MELGGRGGQDETGTAGDRERARESRRGEWRREEELFCPSDPGPGCSGAS